MNCKAYEAILLFVKKKKKKQTTKGSRGFEGGEGKFSTELTTVSEAKATVREKANTCETVQQNPVLQRQQAVAVI